MCKAASEIHKLTELYKQIPLLGNCGISRETKRALSLRGGKGTDSGELDKT